MPVRLRGLALACGLAWSALAVVYAAVERPVAAAEGYAVARTEVASGIDALLALATAGILAWRWRGGKTLWPAGVASAVALAWRVATDRRLVPALGDHAPLMTAILLLDLLSLVLLVAAVPLLFADAARRPGAGEPEA